MNKYRPIKDIEKEHLPCWFKSAIAYIENNHKNKLSIDEIAKKAGLSKYHFCRVFKTLTDQTVIQYVNTVRIEKAKQLLKNPYLNITEICFKVGFSDISHFNKIFKRMVGMTPSGYKKNKPQ